jgi:hypothetical protein
MKRQIRSFVTRFGEILENFCAGHGRFGRSRRAEATKWPVAGDDERRNCQPAGKPWKTFGQALP